MDDCHKVSNTVSGSKTEDRAEKQEEEEDKACEFHLRQASGGFKQNIKGAESNMSFTQDCAAFRQKPAIKASPPKETPSDWVYHGHNSSLYRIRGLKLVQRLAKMTC